MNSFGLIGIGLLLGIVGGIVIIAVVALVYLSWRQRASIQSSREAMQQAVAANTAATEKLRTDMTLMLQTVDAERMYQASLEMQRTMQRLTVTANFLHKMIYAGSGEQQPTAPMEYGLGSLGIDADTADTAGVVGDDADRIAEQQYFSRTTRQPQSARASWPPITGMAMQPEPASTTPPDRPEPLDPVQKLPDMQDAYSTEFEETP